VRRSRRSASTRSPAGSSTMTTGPVRIPPGCRTRRHRTRRGPRCGVGSRRSRPPRSPTCSWRVRRPPRTFPQRVGRRAAGRAPAERIEVWGRSADEHVVGAETVGIACAAIRRLPTTSGWRRSPGCRVLVGGRSLSPPKPLGDRQRPTAPRSLDGAPPLGDLRLGGVRRSSERSNLSQLRAAPSMFVTLRRVQDQQDTRPWNS